MDFYSNTKNGLFQDNVRKQIADYVSTLKDARYKITIEKLKSNRSLQQNKLYWVYVTIVANELGYDKDEMHDLIKFKFLKVEKVFEKTGEVFEHIKSTAKLTKAEFIEFVENLQRWASESFNIILPSPGEEITLSFD